ncbi:MAG: carboxypeptidase M32 [Fibrobacterales bacterium]
MSNYDALLTYTKEVGSVAAAMNVLGWDMETYMPKESGEARAETLGVLSKVLHEKMVAQQYGDLIEAAAAEKGLSASQCAQIAEIKRDREKMVKLPEALVVEKSKVTSMAQQEWSKARNQGSPSDFLPWLDKVVAIAQQEAECLKTEGMTPYDALLDEYERGANATTIDALFGTLKNELVPLIAAIADAGQPTENLLEGRSFDIGMQKKVNNTLLDLIGFNMGCGRIDESEHPFTTNFHPTDVRLTTRYDTHNLIDSVFSTLHEGGHGLYEQGLPIETAGTPLSEAVSLGVHESQSRFWENCIGRSEIFWNKNYSMLQQSFGDTLKDIDSRQFYTLVNRVAPSFIRVDADEITYNMHIILRYEVEKALFNGEITSREIEGVWNSKMKEYLGIVPQSPLEGFMQDVHWSAGLFGYFPTYALGNMNAAQIFEAIKREVPDFTTQMNAGSYGFLNEWLQKSIWKWGRELSPSELITQATGEALNPQYFTDYLKEKYGAIYGITV